MNKFARIPLLIIVTILTTIFTQAQIIPIYEAKVGGLMGGVQNGKWLTPAQVAPSLKDHEEYVLATWMGVEEGGVTFGTKPEIEEPCEDFYFMKLELEIDTGIAIGSGAKWNIVPRTPKAINLKDPVYVSMVSTFLKTKKTPKPQVKITQAYRVDLEGDGQEEVLIAATRYISNDTSDANKGDYSFVMLRKIVGGKVQNMLLDGEFYNSFKDFSAPNTYEFSGVADLNGDGKMEIIVHSHYYEGSSSWIYEMKAGKPVNVKELNVGCGV